MNTVLWCGGTTEAWREAGCDGPACLRPLVDRPMVQHVIERLVDAGHSTFHLLCDEHQPALEQALGNGVRWGATFSYWRGTALANNALLRTLAGTGPVLFGTAATMPVHERALLADAGAGVTLFVTAAEHAWTGWAWMDAETVAACASTLPLTRAPEPACPRGAFSNADVEHLIDVRTPAALLASEALLLQGAIPDLELTGRQPEPGIWIGRGATVHASARLIAPVHVGPRAHVGAHAQVGPFVVVGEGSVVEHGTVLRRASISPGNYVGPDLDVDSAVAVGRMLVDTRLGVTVEVADRFLMDRL